jgi:hypothetical protein
MRCKTLLVLCVVSLAACTKAPVLPYLREETIGDTNDAVLERDGERIVMKEGTATESANVESFNHFSFSPSGRYVLFYSQLWEGGHWNVYDSESRRIVAEPTGHMGMASGERRLFECGAEDYGSSFHAKIASLPDGETVIDVVDALKLDYAQSGRYVVDCTALAHNDSQVLFTVRDMEAGPIDGKYPPLRTVMVDADDGRIIADDRQD